MYYSVVSRSVMKQTTAAAAQASRMAATSTQTRSYTSTMHDNDPKVLEREKARSLRKEQHLSPIHNAPGWNESLASASEANVKADRFECSPSDLTAQTVEYLRRRHQEEEEDLKKALAESAGAQPEDIHEERVDAREASYERDEISGPLREKGVREKVESKKETIKKPA